MPVTRQKLGKYRITRRIAEGGFAAVYRAQDTVEGISVALKIPHRRLLTRLALEDLRKEVRLTANLDHPNILSIKNASVVGKRFLIAYPLGDESLDDRLRRRLSVKTALCFAEQLLEAVAFAHARRIVHCDIKPDNVILFPEGRLRLTDFGIAKVALKTGTLHASGAGTIGYMAPEQALGKPSYRSDVFSLGLVIYRMFSGRLPEWPYDWPPPGHDRLRQILHPDFLALLERAIRVDQRERYEDATRMLSAFRRLRGRALRPGGTRRRRRPRPRSGTPAWRTVRVREFKRLFGSALQTRAACRRCGGPVGEAMFACPWCGAGQQLYKGPTSFPRRCRRCGRGTKLDWQFCAWCYGPSIGPETNRRYTDIRYTARCSGPSCSRKELMPYMRYCPWCHVRVRRGWKVADSSAKCRRCGWGILPEYWDYCPWCGDDQRKR